MESTESSYVSSPEAPRKRSPPPPKSPTSGLSDPICFLSLQFLFYFILVFCNFYSCNLFLLT
jgi:hypothetical protein